MKKSLLLTLLVIIVLLVSSCHKEDDPPVASFSMDKTTAHVGETITFINTSVNAGFCIWYFGDGTNDAFNKNATTHTYSVSGNFTVELFASKKADSDSKKFVDSATKTIIITQ